MRLYIWEGANRVDVIKAYALWAEELCSAEAHCDGVCCCLIPTAVGHAQMMPISEEHLLNACGHSVGLAPMAMEIKQSDISIEGFYRNRGYAVLGTVIDGDCGLDVMCMMASEPQTLRQRACIREELYEYVVQRIHEPWMRRLMDSCQEISWEDVDLAQTCAEMVDVKCDASVAEPSAKLAPSPEDVELVALDGKDCAP